jgi:hypothetical protein
MDTHPKSEAWLLMKLPRSAAAVGARHVAPLQLRQHAVATFIEFAMNLPRIYEKSGLASS